VILTASANWLTPRKIAWREFSPVTICFAMIFFLLVELVRLWCRQFLGAPDGGSES
jgi:hypothetical protein